MRALIHAVLIVGALLATALPAQAARPRHHAAHLTHRHSRAHHATRHARRFSHRAHGGAGRAARLP